MFYFNQSNKSALEAVLKKAVATAVESLSLVGTKEYLQRQLALASVERMKIASHFTSLPLTMVSEETYADSIRRENEAERKLLWKYRNYDIRSILLNSILHNKKSIQFLVRDTFTSLLRLSVLQGKNEITLGQIVHTMKLNSNSYTLRSGEEYPADMWIVDQMRLQLLSELAEMNYLNLKHMGKTHTVSFTEETLSQMNLEAVYKIMPHTELLNSNTLYTEIPKIPLNLISRNSWFYTTPTLYKADMEFNAIMNGTKWEFIPNAIDKIEDAFKEHLKLGGKPYETWMESKVRWYKRQIDASNANGGHYILSKDDSARRRYQQADIGHTQTSSALRALVKPQGIKNPVKYDMSNNVVQIYALALKSKNLASYVGLVDSTEAKEDLRYLISKHMNRELNCSYFNKGNIKPLFMIWAYNAGKTRILEGVYVEEENFFTKEIETTLKTPGLLALTENTIDGGVLWETFTSVIYTLVPEIVELKRIVNRVIQGNPFTLTTWELPDNTIGQYASVVTKQQTLMWVSSKGNKYVHTHHRKELEANAKAAGLLPRWIHSIDAYIMRQLVIRGNKLGIIIVPNHDSFIFDRIHTDTVFSMVKQLFIEVMEGNTFYKILDSFNENKVSLYTEYSVDDVLTKEDILRGTPMKLEEY